MGTEGEKNGELRELNTEADVLTEAKMRKSRRAGYAFIKERGLRD